MTGDSAVSVKWLSDVLVMPWPCMCIVTQNHASCILLTETESLHSAQSLLTRQPIIGSTASACTLHELLHLQTKACEGRLMVVDTLKVEPKTVGAPPSSMSARCDAWYPPQCRQYFFHLKLSSGSGQTACCSHLQLHCMPLFSHEHLQLSLVHMLTSGLESKSVQSPRKCPSPVICSALVTAAGSTRSPPGQPSGWSSQAFCAHGRH